MLTGPRWTDGHQSPGVLGFSQGARIVAKRAGRGFGEGQLFVLVVLAHHRRRVVHFHVTEHPTAQWTAQQIVEAFPNEIAPCYLLRNRDTIYGHVFRQRVTGMGIAEIAAPHSPWQNPVAERLIGSIRRERLDHVLILSERHLRRILTCCRVEGWRGTPCARLQPPPDRTARTGFPYAALLPALRQGL
jgi:hypothetical protein